MSLSWAETNSHDTLTKALYYYAHSLSRISHSLFYCHECCFCWHGMRNWPGPASNPQGWPNLDETASRQPAVDHFTPTPRSPGSP
jgi:hypothetical protein